jgi:ADP-heptose:LPS heptosyltransferase
VLALPLLTALRRKFPAANLELIGKSWLDDLFAGTSLCDRSHLLVPPWTRYSGKYRLWESDWRRFTRQLLELRRERFDWLISIRYDPREVLELRILDARFKVAYGNAAGVDLNLGTPPHINDMTHVSRDAAYVAQALTGQSAESRPAFRVLPESSRQALDRLQSQGYRDGLVVAVSWGAGHPIRRWEPSRFSAVLSGLPERVGFIALVGEPGQPAPIDAPAHIPSARWEGSLSELKGLLSVTDLIIATDSGVMHVASACGCRVVAVFGPQRPEWFGPYDPQDRVALVEPMPCRPCFDACIYDEPICMVGVSHDRVSRDAREAMTALGRPRADAFREARC